MKKEINEEVTIKENPEDLIGKISGKKIIKEMLEEGLYIAEMDKGSNYFSITRKVDKLGYISKIQKPCKIQFGWENTYIGTSRKRIVQIFIQKDDTSIGDTIPWINPREYVDIYESMSESVKCWKKEIRALEKIKREPNLISDLKKQVNSYSDLFPEMLSTLKETKESVENSIPMFSDMLKRMNEDYDKKKSELNKLEKKYKKGEKDKDIEDMRKLVKESLDIKTDLEQRIKGYKNMLETIKNYV